MTVAEVAKLWRQRRETIYRKVRSGEIRAVRLGDETAALRIPRDEVERVHEMSGMGSGSFAAGEPALGHGSFADAGGLSPPRPQTPAAHRVPEDAPAVDARSRAGDDG
jgi:excisionase family DNA binding protein